MAIEPTKNVGTRLLFENERVRVWDLALEPGKWLEKHLHSEDFFFIVLNGGSLRHVDPEHPENHRAVNYQDDLVVFQEAGKGTIHERLVNVGSEPMSEFSGRTQKTALIQADSRRTKICFIFCGSNAKFHKK